MIRLRTPSNYSFPEDEHTKRICDFIYEISLPLIALEDHLFSIILDMSCVGFLPTISFGVCILHIL